MLLLNTFIVEDSPIILDNLVGTLEELAQVKVIGSAADEKSAVKWLQECGSTADLLIIDIFLKTGSGLGVLKAAAEAKVPGKRVVLTNYATDDMRDKCRSLGADRVFDKSTDLEALLDYCHRLASGGPTTITAPLS